MMVCMDCYGCGGHSDSCSRGEEPTEFELSSSCVSVSVTVTASDGGGLDVEMSAGGPVGQPPMTAIM